MATYYVREQGAVIQKTDQRLLVYKDEKEIARIPLHDLDQLIVMGNVQITTQAKTSLLSAGIDVGFMSIAGKLRGWLISDDSKNSELRLRQMQAMSAPNMALSLAKQVVAGKLLNQEAVLLNEGNALPMLEEAGSSRTAPARVTGNISEAARGIRDMLARGMNALDADSLRGFEGKAATYYWPAFRRLLKRDMGFQGRVYRPTPDPVNALLSFGYALLQKDVTSMARLVGFDAYLGFFHTVQSGRPSLVLDVMEEFRPIVVDMMVIEMIARDDIAAADFVRGEKDSGFTLKESPLRRVIEAYEERLEAKVRYGLRNENLRLRQCIEEQVRQLARVVKGEAQSYLPIAAM